MFEPTAIYAPNPHRYDLSLIHIFSRGSVQLDSLDDLVQQGLDGGDQGFQRLASVGNRILLGRSHLGAGQRLSLIHICRRR